MKKKIHNSSYLKEFCQWSSAFATPWESFMQNRNGNLILIWILVKSRGTWKQEAKFLYLFWTQHPLYYFMKFIFALIFILHGKRMGLFSFIKWDSKVPEKAWKSSCALDLPRQVMLVNNLPLQSTAFDFFSGLLKLPCL